jgi:uncharacterized protein (DUF302 family)
MQTPKSNQITHLSVKLNTTFEKFTRQLERALGKFDPKQIAVHFEAPVLLQDTIKKMQGYEELMLFNKYDHGALLTAISAPRKAIHYMIGNPLIASTMTHHDLRAGLYAPLQALVYEGEDLTAYIEYDLPSDLFGQFKNANVNLTGKSLDTKFENLIKMADSQG